MKAIKIAIPAFLLFFFLSVFAGFAQTMTVQNYFFNYYNQFSLADLGFLGGSRCRKTFFRLTFGGSTATPQQITFSIDHASLMGGTSYGEVVTGHTELVSFDYFLGIEQEPARGPVWTNCDIADDDDLDFDTTIDGTFENKYNAINGFPEGRYTVTIRLMPENVPRIITFNVKPYLLQYQLPRDGARVTEASLIFSVRTNLKDPTLHLHHRSYGEVTYPLGAADSVYPQTYPVYSHEIPIGWESGNYTWYVTGGIAESASGSDRNIEGPEMSFWLVDPGEEDEILSSLTSEQKDIIMAMLLQLLQNEGSDWYDRLIQEEATIRDISLDSDDGDGAAAGVTYVDVINMLQQLQVGNYNPITIDD
jgi:hypothetical protein